jgi:diguanylate cyclase (GGDEF)-like protein/PAS domain S-box-containing protein
MFGVYAQSIIAERRRAEEALSQSEEKYRTILEEMQDAYFEVDLAGNFTFVNDSTCRNLGYSTEEMLGTSYRAFTVQEDLEPVYKTFNQAYRTGEPVEGFTWRAVRKDGSTRFFETSVSPLRNGEGEIVGFRCVARDVTERKRMEEKVLRFNAVLKVLKDIDLLVTDEMDREVLINYSCNLILQAGNYANVWVLLVDENRGFVSVASAGDRDRLLLLANHMKQAHYPPCVGEVLRQENPSVVYDNLDSQHGECPLFGACGDNAAFVARLESHGKVYGVLGVSVSPEMTTDEDEWTLLQEVARDISYGLSRIETEKERGEAERQLAYAATHDALTGLPNRVLFNDRLHMALAQAERNHRTLAVVLLDLDKFKGINDTMGHNMGDQVLQGVGKRLTRLVRKSDTVARWGGDEFILVLPEIARAEDTGKVAQRILEAFRKPFVLGGHWLHITTSIGIVTYPNDGGDAETLIKNADAALYRAKGQGRDNYQLWATEQEEVLVGK